MAWPRGRFGGLDEGGLRRDGRWVGGWCGGVVLFLFFFLLIPSVFWVQWGSYDLIRQLGSCCEAAVWLCAMVGGFQWQIPQN